jgi:hypothetical protein
VILKNWAVAILTVMLVLVAGITGQAQQTYQQRAPHVVSLPYVSLGTPTMYYANGVAAGATATETAITLTKSSGTAATSTAASQTLTAGRRFHVQMMVFTSRGHATATAQTTLFSLRVNTGGAVTTATTPAVMQVLTETPAAINAVDRVIIPFTDGYEILGTSTLQWGVTALATYVTNAPTWDVLIIGYVY